MKRLILCLALGCSEHSAPPEPADVHPVAPARGLTRTAAPPVKSCEARIGEALATPGLAGTPALDRVRAQVLGRAKATPVLFVEEPALAPPLDAEAAGLRKALELDPSSHTIGQLYHRLRRQPELARNILLREGYLYVDAPGLAFALLEKVELGHLFDAPELVIQRGSELLYATRKDEAYVYATGAEAGERAKVLLFDRVWDKAEPPGPPRHVDLEALADALGFWRVRAEHASEHAVVAQLAYGDRWVRTLLKRSGASLAFDCEVLRADEREAVFDARRQAKERRALLRVEQRAIESMVREALPFDEPKTEDGQQDGNLRPKWRGAYSRGESSYEFNEDTYPVFDAMGRPRVPQVCIDFITDTFERASGTWWASRPEERSRTTGRLTFDAFDIDNKRSVERFTKFAWEHPEQFDVYFLKSEERVQLRQGDAFYEHLEAEAARYQPGDIVSILGLRSDEKYHYHSFFVYKSDPVTGMPIWLAGNAGRPRLRSWYGELLSAPRRSIHSRIRPRLEWLRSFLDAETSLAAEPVVTAEGSG